MADLRKLFRLGCLLFLLAFASLSAPAQTLSVGAVGELPIPVTGGLPVPVTGTETFIQTGFAASRDGSVNVAGFYWLQAPCPAAVKIKFFRPSNAVPGGEFIYLDQRGPFDVKGTYQEVSLNPPVALRRGDLVAISNVTSCGRPMTVEYRLSILPWTGPVVPPYYAVVGDVVSNIVPTTPVPTSGTAVYVFAADRDDLNLLNRRFQITMIATNPRTGATAKGVPFLLGETSGYFSLPEFTGDPTFPEVTVKMVDATAIPALRGDFWFFHAPLTDVQYTLTVRDTHRGSVKTYSNSTGSSGLLCGGVDTSAFPP